MLGGEHCYIVINCPLGGISEISISYLGPIFIVRRGGEHNNDTIYSATGRYRDVPVDPPSESKSDCPTCKFEECILVKAELLKYNGYRVPDYSIFGPNSNSFARRLVESCGGKVIGKGPITGWDDTGKVGF